MNIRVNDNNQVTIENEPIQEVGKFVYLGCEVSKDVGISNEVSIRIDNAGAAFRNMEKVWNEDGMSFRTKLKLLNSLVTLCFDV